MYVLVAHLRHFCRGTDLVQIWNRNREKLINISDPLKTANPCNSLSYTDLVSDYFGLLFHIISLPQSLHPGWCHPALAAPADQRLRLAEDLPVHLLGCTSAVMLPA